MANPAASDSLRDGDRHGQAGGDAGPQSLPKYLFASNQARLAEAGRDSGLAAPTCILVAPSGQYRVSPHKVARFGPDTAQKLSRAIKELNQQGINPTITSGYRTPDDQHALLSDPSATTPAKISWHEAGSAVDFGPNSNAGNDKAIRRAMTDAGFVWGGTFKKPDRLHYQNSPPGTSPDPAYIRACLKAMTEK